MAEAPMSLLTGGRSSAVPRKTGQAAVETAAQEEAEKAQLAGLIAQVNQIMQAQLSTDRSLIELERTLSEKILGLLDAVLKSSQEQENDTTLEALRLRLDEEMAARNQAQIELARLQAEATGLAAQLQASKDALVMLNQRLQQAIGGSADRPAYELVVTGRDVNQRMRNMTLKPVTPNS